MTPNCETFLEKLTETGSDQDAELRHHLEVCPSCQQSASALSALHSTRAEPSAKAASSLAVRVRVTQAQRDGKRAGALPLRTGLWAGALAAAVVVTVGLTLDFAFPPKRGPQPGALSPGVEEVAAAQVPVDDEIFSPEAFAEVASDDNYDLDAALEEDPI